LTPFLLRDFTRRQFMKTALASAAVLCFPKIVLSRPAPLDRERSLSFYNLHTGERLETVFWADGAYRSEGLSEVDRFMRDFRTGEVRRIDPRLLDLLCLARIRLGTRHPIHLVSGYRSPETNAMLRRHSRGDRRRSRTACDSFLPATATAPADSFRRHRDRPLFPRGEPAPSRIPREGDSPPLLRASRPAFRSEMPTG